MPLNRCVLMDIVGFLLSTGGLGLAALSVPPDVMFLLQSTRPMNDIPCTRDQRYFFMCYAFELIHFLLIAPPAYF